MADDETTELLDYDETTSRKITYSDEDIEKMMEFIDVNGDGEISASELTRYVQLHGYNPTEDEAHQFIASKDIDGSNTLDKDEFKKFAEEFINTLDDPGDALDVALAEIDTNGDGQLDKHELKTFLCERGQNCLSPEEVDELFNDCKCEGEAFVMRSMLKEVLLEKLYFGDY